MKFSMADLDKQHSVVLAARLMHDLYQQHENMFEPCSQVLEAFPELSPEQVMCIWVGINISECDLDTYESINLVK